MDRKIFLLFLGVIALFCRVPAQTSDFSSNLPLVYINTGGAEIPDDPKIDAEMGIVWNGPGQTNPSGAEFNHFHGRIAIEIRGSSSQMFPKKSYGFELRDAQGQDMDFPLLDMPEEEDWILYAPYTDKTLIRNVLTYTLAGQLGHYTPRCRFVELFVNYQYEGVYVLMEKIKRDKHRVDIARLRPEDVEGDELTGGYIVKIDKTTGSSGGGWYSKYPNAHNRYTHYQHEYPDFDEIQPAQHAYIQNYIDDFEEAVYNGEFDPVTGYQQYIDIASFVDYVIINEITKNVDGYRLSTFLYKDKNEKLNAGPLWDFNLAYGNANYANAWETFGLQAYTDMGDDYWQNPFWWGRLLGDRHFTQALRCRWEELVEEELSLERIMHVTDSLVDLLDKPIDRNYQRWSVMGDWIWPNYFVGHDYNSEVNWMKDWIIERMRTLDNILPGDCDLDPEMPLDFLVSVYPNPVASKLTVQVTNDSDFFIDMDLHSVKGERIMNDSFLVKRGMNKEVVDMRKLLPGIYILRLYRGNEVLETHKIVKL